VADRDVRGWALRFRLITASSASEDDSDRGRNAWLGGEATSKSDAVAQIQAMVMRYHDGPLQHDETIGYLLDRRPDKELLDEYEAGFHRGEGVRGRPEVIAMVTDTDNIPSSIKVSP